MVVLKLLLSLFALFFVWRVVSKHAYVVGFFLIGNWSAASPAGV